MNILIHGYKVEGDPDGILYIKTLTEGEARTLFDEAHTKGKAQFRYHDKHFELVREYQGNSTSMVSYVVTKIGVPSGLFF